MPPIYLDFNATTPVAEVARQVMGSLLGEQFGNPSSQHPAGRASRAAIDRARGQVARLLGCADDEVVFTSGGTESNNWALKGLLLADPTARPGHLVISSLEHPAIVEPARYLQRWGVAVSVVGCDRHGTIDPEAVQQALRPDTRLVSIMLANNEIGTIQPLAEIARRCHARGVWVHTDAAQAVGKIEVRVDQLGVDLLSLAGHKCYAPKGVGALYVRSGLRLEPLLHGAGHERGRRASTENTASIAALGAAAELAAQALGLQSARLERLRDRLWQRLRDEIGRELTCNGQGAARLPNTLSVNFPGVTGGDLLAACPEICASTGSACHSGAVARSATLAAIDLPDEVARGTVRLSLGQSTSDDDIEQAAQRLSSAWRQLSASAGTARPAART